MNWNHINHIEDLEGLDQTSKSQPILIFKHSTRCSISSAALNRLERKWENDKAGKLKPYFLDLISYRQVSNEIAERYGIMHQSPQALVIFDGKCVYNDSHLGISFDEMLDNIKSVNV